MITFQNLLIFLEREFVTFESADPGDLNGKPDILTRSVCTFPKLNIIRTNSSEEYFSLEIVLIQLS